MFFIAINPFPNFISISTSYLFHINPNIHYPFKHEYPSLITQIPIKYPSPISQITVKYPFHSLHKYSFHLSIKDKSAMDVQIHLSIYSLKFELKINQPWMKMKMEDLKCSPLSLLF